MTVKIRRRENHAKAVQWTTQTKAEMLAVVMEWTDYEYGPVASENEIKWGFFPLHRGNWLVMDEVGNVDVYDSDELNSDWEVVE